MQRLTRKSKLRACERGQFLGVRCVELLGRVGRLSHVEGYNQHAELYHRVRAQGSWRKGSVYQHQACRTSGRLGRVYQGVHTLEFKTSGEKSQFLSRESVPGMVGVYQGEWVGVPKPKYPQNR